MERPNRSSAYQAFFLEVSCDDEYLDQFENSKSLAGHLNPFAYDERLLALQDQLHTRLWQLIEQHCTPLQAQILRMYFLDGYTQTEIAALRKCNQSSVIKSLRGNNAYYGTTAKTYGGSLPKLKKLLQTDAEFQEISRQIIELREPRY